jgi:hypothetical protein
MRYEVQAAPWGPDGRNRRYAGVVVDVPVIFKFKLFVGFALKRRCRGGRRAARVRARRIKRRSAGKRVERNFGDVNWRRNDGPGEHWCHWGRCEQRLVGAGNEGKKRVGILHIRSILADHLSKSRQFAGDRGSQRSSGEALLTTSVTRLAAAPELANGRNGVESRVEEVFHVGSFVCERREEWALNVRRHTDCRCRSGGDHGGGVSVARGREHDDERGYSQRSSSRAVVEDAKNKTVIIEWRKRILNRPM